jgi:hypothetical protein
MREVETSALNEWQCRIEFCPHAYTRYADNRNVPRRNILRLGRALYIGNGKKILFEIGCYGPRKKEDEE